MSLTMDNFTNKFQNLVGVFNQAVAVPASIYASIASTNNTTAVIFATTAAALYITSTGVRAMSKLDIKEDRPIISALKKSWNPLKL